MNITTTQNLLTSDWRADVDAMEAAIRHFSSDRLADDRCHIAFFEIPRDTDLHVNVIHSQRTKTVSGWAGPADRPEGFVHNRRFDQQAPNRIVGFIRDMVFAASDDTRAH